MQNQKLLVVYCLKFFFKNLSVLVHKIIDWKSTEHTPLTHISPLSSFFTVEIKILQRNRFVKNCVGWVQVRLISRLWLLLSFVAAFGETNISRWSYRESMLGLHVFLVPLEAHEPCSTEHTVFACWLTMINFTCWIISAIELNSSKQSSHLTVVWRIGVWIWWTFFFWLIMSEILLEPGTAPHRWNGNCFSTQLN